MMDLMILEVLSNLNESVADSGRGTTFWKVTTSQAGHWAGNSLSVCSQGCCSSGTAPAASQTLCLSCDVAFAGECQGKALLWLEQHPGEAAEPMRSLLPVWLLWSCWWLFQVPPAQLPEFLHARGAGGSSPSAGVTPVPSHSREGGAALPSPLARVWEQT